MRRSSDAGDVDRAEPVDAADPAGAVLGVPLDRAEDALLPGHLRLPAGLAVELLVADTQGEHVGDAGAEAAFVEHDLPVVRPVPVLAPEAQDQVSPVGHGDVLALPVDVHVAGHALRRDGQVAAHAVGAEAEVAQRLERAQEDLRPGQRLRDDRAGDVARVLARPVVVEHPRDHARDAERVVVVHRQEVGRDLGGGVDRLRVDRRALVQDQPARRVEVVVVRDRLAHVPVLLRGSGRVELLQLQPPVDDRLEQVQRPDRVRHHRLVGPVPRLTHVRLRAQMEDVRLVRRRVPQLLDQVVDRRAVGQVGELHPQPVAQVRNVVQCPTRRRAHEGGDVGAQLDQRVGDVRPHDPVRPGAQHGAPAVDVRELATQVGDGVVGPGLIVGHRAYASRAVRKPSASPRRSALASGVLTAMSIAVVTGLSAAVGVVIARKIGRGVETDGFFAAYGVFLVLVLAASAVRAAVLPRLARARAGGAFGSLFVSYALAIWIVAAPALLLAIFASDWCAAQLAAGLPSSARDIACAWGTLLNGAVTLAVPLTALLIRAEWGRRDHLLVLGRLGELARASSLAIALQALFVVCLRFVSDLGTGAVTSFTYAYFVAAALVSVTATSLGVVSSVPLTRA